MPWALRFSNRALRELQRLPARDRRAVVAAIDGFVEDFASADVKKLAGRGNDWRVRVGRWRVLVMLDNEAGLITVERVLPRDRAYRD